VKHRPRPKILLGEDNLSLASAVTALLEKRGLQVSHTRDGAETLTRIVADTPDLLILDLRLPKLPGLELLTKLRQSPKTGKLPVVVISDAHLRDKYLSAVGRLGVRHYLEKPFKPSQLLAAIQDELSLKAEASDSTYAQTLCRLFLQRFCGRLTVNTGRQNHEIDFINGLPVSIRPGFKAENFGYFLHQRGQISAEELNYYLHGAEHRQEALVQMGCLDYPALLQAKLAYLTAELIHAGTLSGLELEQQPYAIPADLQLVTVNMPRVIHEIFRQTPANLNRQFLAGGSHKYLAPAERYYDFINFLRLDQNERELQQQLKGDRPLDALLRENDAGLPLARTLLELKMLQISDEPVRPAMPGKLPLRVLFNAGEEEEQDVVEDRLESFADILGSSEVTGDGFIARDKTPDQAATQEDLNSEVRKLHDRLQGKNYYQVFDLRQDNFSFGRLKESYFGLTRKFDPETLMQLGGTEAELVQDILSTVAAAYNTLSDVVKKERYDELLNSDRVGLGRQGDDRFQAQVQYQSARVFIEMEEWDNAEQALQDACNIDPDNGHYLAALAWSIYRNPKNTRSRAMLEKARQLLGKALKLEKSAEGFAYKGWMHFDAGQDTLAEAEFNKALRINSRQQLARQGLRAIQGKQELENKGLFRKMFR